MILTQVISFGYKKLKSYRSKTLFLILPIALLLSIGILLTAEAKNVQQAINQHVIGVLQDESKYIKVAQAQQQGGMGKQQQPYTGSDVQRVESMAGVSKAALGVQAPLGQVTTNDLVSGHTLTLNNITALDSNLSKQYAEASASYNGSGVIPIILSASQFQEMTENWRGQTSISVSMRPPSASGGPASIDPSKSGGPIGTHAITYDRQSLIGKEFTVSVGGLQPLQDYGVEAGASFGQLTYNKYSATEMAKKESDRQEVISHYWDYAKVSAAKAYTFKVVGIINDLNSQTSYIPPQAAQQLMQDEIQKQLDSRVGGAIPTTQLSSFTGLTFDGTTLSPSAAGSGNAMIGGNTSTSYPIPGFVTQTNNNNQTTGVITDANIYNKAIPTSTSMFVELADVYHRSTVVDELNSAGYAYQDTSKLGGLLSVKERLATSVVIFEWVFGGLVVLVLVLAFTRFIAESKREIGIFRALGATKGEVSKLFISQAVLTGVVSYVVGLLVGIGLVAGAAALMSSWFNSVVRDTVSQSALKQALTDGHSFIYADWQGVILLSALLWAAIIVTACVASIQAARISPVEAIKND